MTDEPTEAVFPDAPDAPKYTKLQTSERKAALDAQVKQFEAELAAHYSNHNRLRAVYDAAPAGEEGEAQRTEAVAGANVAVAAIETIKLAIEATQAERAALK